METFQTENRAPTEGRVAEALERRTSRLPSDTFLWMALGSIAGSLTLAIMGKQKLANFVGQWPPTFLLFGVYNKIVKIAGHDRLDRAHLDS